MKQYITEEQWDELKDSQKITMAKSFGDGIEKPEFWTSPGVYIPINIGQMIEYLDKKKGWMDEEYTAHNAIWWEPEDELCDTLWEEVKETL